MPIKSKQPVQSLQDLDKALGIINRAKWTAAKRKAYLKAHPDCFAGPGGTFPIEDASDVGDAWGLAGHAGDPDAVRAKIKAIAKHLGLESALPDTAKDPEHSVIPDTSLDPPPKDPMTTVERSNLAAPPTKDIQFYVPIERFDRDTREVVGTATQEVEDAYGTVIRYEASKDAFTRWAGNIREMHDKHKAVGRALEITPDDANKRIIVRATISKGAEDTWQKIVDGTLTGFSIGGRNGTWSDMKIGERNVPALDRYDLAELSLVDNPGCPGSNDLVIVRSNGEMSQVLALNSEATAEQVQNAEAEAIERAGAKHSKDTRDALHDSAAHQMKGALQTMKNCGCDDCGKVASVLDPDNDGDIDFMGIADTDNDAEQVEADEAERVTRYLAPVYQRLQGIAAQLMPSENDNHYQNLQRENQELRSQLAELKVMTTELKAALDASVERSATPSPALDALKTEILAMRSEVAATKSQVDKIASQPVSGGPTLNAGALPSGISPAEKRFATQGTPQQAPDSAQFVLDRLQAAGVLSSPEAQTAAAAAVIRPMRGYTG